MENKIYQVRTDMNLEILETSYVKKSLSFYWINEINREALNTNWVKSFDTKEEAVRYLKYLLLRQISNTESVLSYYNEQLEKFNLIYNQ